MSRNKNINKNETILKAENKSNHEEREDCCWEYIGGIWNTSCNKHTRDCKPNFYNYCPYCGKRIIFKQEFRYGKTKDY